MNCYACGQKQQELLTLRSGVCGNTGFPSQRKIGAAILSLVSPGRGDKRMVVGRDASCRRTLWTERQARQPGWPQGVKIVFPFGDERVELGYAPNSGDVYLKGDVVRTLVSLSQAMHSLEPSEAHDLYKQAKSRRTRLIASLMMSAAENGRWYRITDYDLRLQ